MIGIGSFGPPNSRPPRLRGMSADKSGHFQYRCFGEEAERSAGPHPWSRTTPRETRRPRSSNSIDSSHRHELMATMYCTLCRRHVEAKRHIGVGTVVLAFVSAGLSLMLIPFYSKRCPICRSAAVTVIANDSEFAHRELPTPERIADLENRLRNAESELEVTTTELDRVRTERDFYRQLLEDPAKRQQDRLRGS